MHNAWVGPALLAVCTTLFGQAVAYRPVQHCKHVGDNGLYSACTALTTTENPSNGRLDLYIRYHWYRYENSKTGWHSIAVGNEMAGAHMLVMYGDPTASDPGVTVSVRTADGHHPPRAVPEFKQFVGHAYPKVNVTSARFESYTGNFVHQTLKQKPTHVGIVEAVIGGFAQWPGTRVIDDSEAQPFIWASNYEQDFAGHFDENVNIEMHAFGQGFGFLWADLKNARTPQPMFGPIDELAGLKGSSEVAHPDPPTKAELEAGDKYIASVIAAQGGAASPNQNAQPPNNVQEDDPDSDEAAPTQPPPPQDEATPVEQPVRTVLGKTLRDWMWHLHGMMMCFAFLALYPLGIYLLRRPPPSANGNGFNSHWTIQSLATVSLAIGVGIGYVNSHSISITHQYIGLSMVLLVAAQMFFGWRHHVIFIATHRRTIFSKLHLWVGRVIMPLGFFNIISGMLLRQYGWFTLVLVLVLIVLESSFLIFVLTTTRNTRTDGVHDHSIAMRDEEAEEYFQLAGDEDDDWSDDEVGGDANGATAKQEEKRKQAERLAKLDKV